LLSKTGWAWVGARARPALSEVLIERSNVPFARKKIPASVMMLAAKMARRIPRRIPKSYREKNNNAGMKHL